MAKAKAVKQSNYPIFRHGLGVSIFFFIVVGFLTGSGVFFFVGLITGLIWAKRYSNERPALKPYWYVMLALFLLPIIYMTVVDVRKLN